MKTRHVIPIQTRWLIALQAGEKTIEGKKDSPTWSGLKVGDEIEFRASDQPDLNLAFLARIVAIRRYKGPGALQNYLTSETLTKTLPGIKTIHEGKEEYLKYWTVSEIQEHGILAIQVEPVKL
jgi:ASC-1-like (ASCH) protein